MTDLSLKSLDRSWRSIIKADGDIHWCSHCGKQSAPQEARHRVGCDPKALLLGLCVHAHLLSCVQLFATLWSGACQASLFMEFSRQEYWSQMPFPTSGDLTNRGMKPASLVPPTLESRFFTTAPPRKPCKPLHTHKEELLCVTLLLTPSELYSGYP